MLSIFSWNANYKMPQSLSLRTTCTICMYVRLDECERVRLETVIVPRVLSQLWFPPSQHTLTDFLLQKQVCNIVMFFEKQLATDILNIVILSL